MEIERYFVMPVHPHFISFEGLDFSGKTTQVEKLVSRLNAIGFPVQVVREPGGTEISEKIRQILLDRSHGEMDPRTEILLYSAARSQLVHQCILPRLENGEYVIADRYVDSTTAYQGYGRGLDIAFVQRLNEFATSRLLPCKTFFLDISPEEAHRRRKSAGRGSDRLEREDRAFFETIRRGYLQIARENPRRYVILNGEDEPEDISRQIWEKVCNIWGIPYP